MVRLTGHLNMTIAVNWDVKLQTNKQKTCSLYDRILVIKKLAIGEQQWHYENKSSPEAIKLFTCSTQPSRNFNCS